MKCARTSGLASAVLFALFAGSPASAQDPVAPTGRRIIVGPDRRVALDFQHYYTVHELDLALTLLCDPVQEAL